jgi:hypothetical protein
LACSLNVVNDHEALIVLHAEQDWCLPGSQGRHPGRFRIRGRQPPFDAFWGARYAIVADPDGNDVGLMSPIDESRRTWPPEESPAP